MESSRVNDTQRDQWPHVKEPSGRPTAPAPPEDQRHYVSDECRQHHVAHEVGTTGDARERASNGNRVPEEPGFGKEASQGCCGGECHGRLTAGEPELGGREGPFRPGPEYVQAVGQAGPLATERQFETFATIPPKAADQNNSRPRRLASRRVESV